MVNDDVEMKADEEKKCEDKSGGILDTSNRKVVVHNVLKYLRNKEVNKLLESWRTCDANKEHKIVIEKAKKPPMDNWMRVTLESESMVGPFMELIHCGGEDGGPMVNRKGKPLHATKQTTAEDNRKRDREDGDDEDGDERSDKRGKRSDELKFMTDDEVRDKVTPLWRQTYDEQIEQKHLDIIKKCNARIIKTLKNKFKTVQKEAKRNADNKTEPPITYEWINDRAAIKSDPPIPSPQLDGYRNKCEFTCGYHHERALKPEDTTEDTAEDTTEDTTEDSTQNTTQDTTQNTTQDTTQNTTLSVHHQRLLDAKNVAEKKTTEKNAAEKNAAEKNAAEKKKNAAEATTEKEVVVRTPAAGFLAGGWRGGVHFPHCLANNPDWSCGIADLITTFLKTSPFKPYNSNVHQGVWRTVAIRCSVRTNECMIVMQHANPKGGGGAGSTPNDSTTEEHEEQAEKFEADKKRLVDILTEGPIPTPKRTYKATNEDEQKDENKKDNKDGLKVTSVFFQEYDGLSNPPPEHPVQHAYGKKTLEERLGKCTFQISPGAFFQVNTEGAETLYSLVVDRVREVAKEEPKKTLLFDVCCGTGTIGLTCLKEGVVGQLVGVDISAPAIADAKANAEKNGFGDEARFVASRAETVLEKEMWKVPKEQQVVAVVDPAREGLHGGVVKALRTCKGLKRIVYVSCNPTGSLVADAALLCGPPSKKYAGTPFRVTDARPVDMFPHTAHCEMVMTFDRMTDEELEEAMIKDAEKKEEKAKIKANRAAAYAAMMDNQAKKTKTDCPAEKMETDSPAEKTENPAEKKGSP